MASGSAEFGAPSPAHPADAAASLIHRESRDFAASSRAATSATAQRWGARVAEFMVVGGATLVFFPLSWVLRRTFGLDASEYALGFATFYAAYVINDPHFSVTYLLFYKNARARLFDESYALSYRVRYAIAGFFVPAMLAVWALTAITSRSAERLGWMVQLMYFLVGWHYVKQGFGVLAVLSSRRGIRFDARERAVILAHAFAGWAYAWASPAAPPGEFEEKGVVYHALGHPRWLEIATACAFAASTAALATVLFAKWRRDKKTLPWVPISGFLISVWSWTIYSSADRLLQYVIPALHSIQYLFFVWLMKRNEARAAEGPPEFGRPAAVRVGFLAVSALGLGWLLFHGAPAALDGLFAPPTLRGRPLSALGATPFLAGLFVIVNIHHYFMDHVIWRRDNPDTRYLREA